MEIQAVYYGGKERRSYPVGEFGVRRAKKVRVFHESFPEYEATRLMALPALSERLGVGGIYVKDESTRFGLNAFKVLGGSYSIGRCIAERLGILEAELTFGRLSDWEVRKRLEPLTFVTATDGNHGRGVAWTAGRLGAKSVVLMPKGSAAERLGNIRALGADARITDWNYDDTVREAKRLSEEKGWLLVQDTAWEGYEKIPTWIMQGYTTMALEAAEQLTAEKIRPTHIFLQAGVGAMAGAVTGFFMDYYGTGKRPVIAVVEPDQADCIFRTAKASDGKLHFVTGEMNSMMAGLCCGEPCTIGWKILEAYADHFISISDRIAAKGMRLLAKPMGIDPLIVSGESGAATIGTVAEILENGAYAQLKEKLGLDETSQILCISTEGDTDKENYCRIVREGLDPA
ncbi:MAG: diaminopropionate ammonia-lyase [Lachnospiraceae bacterium]|nr:diaminopropionate ammonia-lyase [Lachnospiraceae bacterium]